MPISWVTFSGILLPNGTDLRGYRSVEGSIRDALGKFLGDDGRFENIQVSSRTDRGPLQSFVLFQTCVSSYA